MNKDERIFRVMTTHTHRRSWASIIGMVVGGTLLLAGALVWLAQGFNPLAAGYGVFVFLVSLAMK
jgi:hypothetical protein